MSVNKLYSLLEKFRNSKCTPEEIELLDHWYRQFDDQAERMPEIPAEKLETLFGKIEHRINTPSLRAEQAGRTGQAKHHKIIRQWITVAATVVAVLSATWYLTLSTAPLPEETNTIQALIQPGHWQAQLQLSDGSKVLLDGKAEIREKEGMIIKNDTSRILDYTQVKKETGKEIYNTITVPLGGIYGLVLADGTKVWLNAGSELKYPVAFSGPKREISLIGEAYFDVAKSTIPFIVKTSDMEIRVLGTVFNVSAYTDDESVRTTLVRGSVSVRNNHDEQEYRMIPGNTFSYTRKNEKVNLEMCDTELYTSWKNGEFKFRDMSLEEIMIKLNRWYDCRVEYEKETLKNLRFSGAAERDRPVDYLLQMIETVTDVKFEIVGTTIIVRNK